MHVTISKASELVGVTRATFYRHIEKKNITVKKDEDGNPKVDVAELVRVYGNKVKTPAQLEVQKHQAHHMQVMKQRGKDQADAQNAESAQILSVESSIELGVLKERVKALENERNTAGNERTRERDMLEQQIEALRDSLSQSQEQQKRLTLLLTDQRGNSEQETQATQTEQVREADKIDTLNETIETLRKQNRAIIRKIKQQDQERQKPLWKKLFGG